jgi:hypothetical protein
MLIVIIIGFDRVFNGTLRTYRKSILRSFMNTTTASQLLIGNIFGCDGVF